jgi:hypothetical protein
LQSESAEKTSEIVGFGYELPGSLGWHPVSDLPPPRAEAPPDYRFVETGRQQPILAAPHSTAR